MWHLVRKEIAEHGWVFLALFPLTLFGFGFTLLVTTINEAGSPLESVRFFGLSLLIMIELILCNRLVVQEYSGKHQLFLEALPISRLVMLWTKYVLGFVITVALLAGCFLLGLLVASRSEILDLRFIALMSIRLLVYAFCSYSFFFMMGLLGRYRIASYIAIFILWMVLQESTSFETEDHGPLGLLNSQFPYERSVFPIQNLLVCGLAGVGFVVVSLMMGLMREGSVASLMAERMSYREKLFLTAILLTMMISATVLDERKRPDPYSINDAVAREGRDFSVQVEAAEDEEKATELADLLVDDLQRIGDFLGVEEPADVFVVSRRDLDGDRYELGDLENASGTLLRVNYVNDAWNPLSFRPFAIETWLNNTTNSNASYEPQCWVLEGFADYWPRRGSVDGTEEGLQWDPSQKVDLRAAYGASLGFAASDVDDWYRFRERLGRPIVRAIACSGLVIAQRNYGEEKLRAFLQKMLGGTQPDSASSDWRRFSNPIASVWRETMGTDYATFKAEWEAELRSLATRWESQLATVPRLKADAQFIAKSEVSFELSLKITCEPASPSVIVKYQRIDEFDVCEDDLESKEQVEPYVPASAIVVRQLFNAGERLRWTISLKSLELDCEVISGWQRQEVQQ
jgi:hypothetical protein